MIRGYPIRLHDLIAILEKVSALAKDLYADKPTYELAIAGGVEEKFITDPGKDPVWGYRGEAVIHMANGSIWRAIGDPAVIHGDHIFRQGRIRYECIREATLSETDEGS